MNETYSIPKPSHPLYLILTGLLLFVVISATVPLRGELLTVCSEAGVLAGVVLAALASGEKVDR